MSEIAFQLTAEELHFLAVEHELEVVPGLDLPPDAELDLLVGTAMRSLVERDLGEFGPDGTFEPLEELSELLGPLADLAWLATAELESKDEIGSWGWWEADGKVVELAQTSPTDYVLSLLEEDLRTRLAVVLAPGESETHVYASHLVVTPEGDAEGVELEWIDRGGERVDVVENGVATPTARAAVLDELLS